NLGGDRLGQRNLDRHLQRRLADHPHPRHPDREDGPRPRLRRPRRRRRSHPGRLQRRLPLSTTHVISGGIMGAGAGKRLSAVRWGVAGNIVAGWVITLPAAAIFAALIYEISS